MAWITLYMPYWHILYWMKHRLRVRDSSPGRGACCLFAKASRPAQEPIQLNVYQGTLPRRWSGRSTKSRKLTSIQQIQRSRVDPGSPSPWSSPWTEISWLKKLTFTLINNRNNKLLFALFIISQQCCQRATCASANKLGFFLGHSLNRASRYSHVRKTNKIHTFS